MKTRAIVLIAIAFVLSALVRSHAQKANSLTVYGSYPAAQDTPLTSYSAIGAGCSTDDVSDGTDGARISPEWTPVTHDSSQPFPNDPVYVLEGRVATPHDKFGQRSGLSQEATTDQAPSEVAEEDIPWIHYTHDKTMDVIPDPGYKHLLSQHLVPQSDGSDAYVPRDTMEVEWEAGGVGAEEGTSFIDNIWGALPEWAWASAGDRVWVAGRWVFDCGHVSVPDDSHTDLKYVGFSTELHPPRAMVVFRLNHRLSLLGPNNYGAGDGGTGGESGPSTWLPITGGNTAIPVTEADIFVSGFGGSAQDVCSVTNNHISKSGTSDYGDCTHTSPMIAVNNMNYVFDIYPPGTNFTQKDANGNWPVTPPTANAALQWRVIDRLQLSSYPTGYSYNSWIPTHTCGKGSSSVSPALCTTYDPSICLVDDKTPAPTQTETSCPTSVPARPTRLRVILPFSGTDANAFAQSILLGWDDVPPSATANQFYSIAVHQYSVQNNGESFPHDGDWRVYVDVAGQWRYLSNPEFFDKNSDGSNVCHGDSLLDNGDTNPDCFQFDNHPWLLSLPTGMPVHVAVGGYEADSVDGYLCWEKDNYFNGGDCSFSALAGAALAFENDDRLGTLEFDLDPATGYSSIVQNSLTYDVSYSTSTVNGFPALTFGTKDLDNSCVDVKNATGGLSGWETVEQFLGDFIPFINGPCGQDGVKYQVQFTVAPVLGPTIPVANALRAGNPSYKPNDTTFVAAATPLILSTNSSGNVGFQYRFVPDGGTPMQFSFGLPFPFYWLWTDFAGGPRSSVQVSGFEAGFNGDGGYGVEYSAVANPCNNIFGCAVTEPRHSSHIYLDTTPPVTTIIQPMGTTYSHSDTLTLSYSTSDGAGSGVQSFTPKMDGMLTLTDGTGLASGQSILLLTEMMLGTHTFSVDSVDNVDNAGTNSVTFTITVTPESLKQDVNIFLSSGCINNAGIAQSLVAKISSAEMLIGRGNTQAAINTLAALVYEVQAQAGHHVSTACSVLGHSVNAAQILIGDAQYLEGTLGSTPNPLLGFVTATGVPITGATVNLLSSSKTIYATVATDSAGFYYFNDVSGLIPGAKYTAMVVPPKGYKGSMPASQTFTWNGGMRLFSNVVLY